MVHCTSKPTSTCGGCHGTFIESGRNLTEETSHMSIQSHLAELERRHRALEDEIAEALAHPSTDDLKIAELKRRKLQVKDEIARLRQEASTVH
jgi:hypothetical protein